mgnify:CR=1 FL=1
MQFLIPLAYFCFFVFVITKSSFFFLAPIARRWLVFVFAAKVLAGFVLMYIYTYYYDGGDLQLYFNNGNILFDLLCHHPSRFCDVVFCNAYEPTLRGWTSYFHQWYYNDARTMMLVNMLFRFFSFGLFNVHIVLISCILCLYFPLFL